MKYVDYLQGINGRIKVREYRTATLGTASQYNQRVGNRIPVRTLIDATLPMPTLVTANDITSNGFRLVIDSDDYIFEVSEDGVILAISSAKEILITRKLPNTTYRLKVVALRTNGEYSQPYEVVVQTQIAQSIYPYNVGDSEPIRVDSDTLPAPLQISLSFVSVNVARINWSPPSSQSIDYYEVILNDVIVAITTATYVDISGLTPLTSYTAKVRSVNIRNEFSLAVQETKTSPESVTQELPAGGIDAVEGDYV